MTDKVDIFKILILGDSSVGKTCLLLKYTDNRFQETHMPTIGIDFKSKMVDIDGRKIKIQLWDTAGQDRFKTITKTLYNNVLGICLCYSVADRKSFENIQIWMKQIKENVGDDVAITLLGNKCDIPDREVQGNEGEQLADQYKIQFSECSAKTGQNVNEIFLNQAKEILKNIQKNPNLYNYPEKNNNTQLTANNSQTTNKKSKACC